MYTVREVSLRCLLDEELKVFIDIEKKDLAHPWTEQMWGDLVQSDHYYLFAIDYKGLTVGFSLFHFVDCDVAHLLKIVIVEKFQKIGLATKLLKHNISFFTNVAARSIYLEVAENNFTALKFYERHGFNHLSIKKKFYTDGQNACAMQLVLE